MKPHLPKIKEQERVKKTRTPQLGDDLFYNVATPYRYEKPMPQHFPGEPQPPFCFFFLTLFRNFLNEEFKEQEQKQKAQQQNKSNLCSVASVRGGEGGDTF